MLFKVEIEQSVYFTAISGRRSIEGNWSLFGATLLLVTGHTTCWSLKKHFKDEQEYFCAVLEQNQSGSQAAPAGPTARVPPPATPTGHEGGEDSVQSLTTTRSERTRLHDYNTTCTLAPWLVATLRLRTRTSPSLRM